MLQLPHSFLSSLLGLALLGTTSLLYNTPFPAVHVGCANLCLPVHSCAQLSLWQPVALVSLASCTPRCLHEAIQTIVYKP